MRKITLLLALFLTGSISTMAQDGPPTPQKHDIEPMLTTVWAQNDPYHFYTPAFFTGEQCVTGCVSVAAAQVMKYYEWPKRGIGSSSYDWNNGVTTKELTCNYEHDYDWSLMVNDIDTAAMTPAQRQEAGVTMYNVVAIARLMADLGIAFEMQYRPRPSSAYLSKVPASLVEHFAYDRSARFAYRDYYTDEAWEDLIYTELAEGRPVIYAGSSSTGSHSFVIDGYAQGKFHCNWGWGGFSDGYYSLNNLTPTYDTGGEDTPGIEGYNKNHFAVIGIRPFAGSDWTYSMGITKDFQVCETDAEGYLVPVTKINRETVGKYWYLYGGSGTANDVGFKNISPIDMYTEFGIEFTNTDNGHTFVLASPVGVQPLPANSGFPYVAFSYTDIMQTGTFDLRPVFRPMGTNKWIPVMQTPNAKKVQLTVEGTTPPVYLTEPLTVGRNSICYSNTITVKASIYSTEDIDDVWINPVVYSLEGIQPVPVMETINGQQYYLGQQRDFFKLVNLKQGLNEVELSVDYPEADPDKQYIIYCQYYKDADFNGVFEPQSNAMVMFKITSEADAIHGVTADWNSVELPSFKGVFDMSGRRISDKPKALSRGMYIVNGKKIVVR